MLVRSAHRDMTDMSDMSDISDKIWVAQVTRESVHILHIDNF